MFDEIKTILDEPVSCLDGSSHYIDESLKRYLASQICQKFPKSPDNPDGYEPKPDAESSNGRTVGFEPTNESSILSSAKPDESRLLTKERILEIWDECGGGCAWGEYAMAIAKAQRDLTAKKKDKECLKRLQVVEETLQQLHQKAQDKWMESLLRKDAECRARARRIFRKIERIAEPTVPMTIDYRKYMKVKKEELKERYYGCK